MDVRNVGSFWGRSERERGRELQTGRKPLCVLVPDKELEFGTYEVLETQ